MASTLNLRLASVTARDGFDTRNKELNVACNEKQELASEVIFGLSPREGETLQMAADREIDEWLAREVPRTVSAEGKLKKWIEDLPIATMEILEPTEYTAVPWVKSAWDNWVAWATSSRVDTGAGIYDPVSAENSYWNELMDILWKAHNDLDMSWDSHELAVSYCEFSRELISARHDIEEAIRDARSSGFSNNTVSYAKQMIQFAADGVWVEWENVKCEDKKCNKVATTCFHHMSGRKDWLCEFCFMCADHED